MYINDTVNEQEYQLRTERKTVQTCDIEIFNGCVTEAGAELKIEIPVPGCVLESGASFKREYAMENTTSTSVEEEMTWSIESNIKVLILSSINCWTFRDFREEFYKISRC